MKEHPKATRQQDFFRLSRLLTRPEMINNVYVIIKRRQIASTLLPGPPNFGDAATAAAVRGGNRAPLRLCLNRRETLGQTIISRRIFLRGVLACFLRLFRRVLCNFVVPAEAQVSTEGELSAIHTSRAVCPLKTLRHSNFRQTVVLWRSDFVGGGLGKIIV